ncbi:hypothetical protein EU537_06540 [Candidatus Thorarchaeota archaeon]|nr:MAG: hypothetical protein EU537_06540 [Candidatus Thorarchaeota archaeon]
MRCIEFLAEDAPVFLDAHNACILLKARQKELASVEVSLDLGLSTQSVDFSEWDCDAQELDKIVKKPNSAYIIRDGTANEIAIRNSIEYRLRPTEKGQAPALVIDEELMHQIAPLGPMEYARRRAELAVNPGWRVLDIGTGLGYSAIASLDRDAHEVVSIEKHPEVIELSRMNPWSQRLHEDERVSIVIGDAFEVVSTLRVDSFDSVFHDPPQIQLTPKLYSTKMYRLIGQVLVPDGQLCHYVGPEGFSYRGQEVAKLVENRLRGNGFHSIEFIPKLQSILATYGDK